MDSRWGSNLGSCARFARLPKVHPPHWLEFSQGCYRMLGGRRNPLMWRTMPPLGSTAVKALNMGCAPSGCNPHEFRLQGQVGQESHRRPAVVETPSDVSGGGGRHRHMPLCPTLAVVCCRRVSPCVAVCRRSRGQILGQPLLPRALFSLPDPAAVP